MNAINLLDIVHPIDNAASSGGCAAATIVALRMICLTRRIRRAIRIASSATIIVAGALMVHLCIANNSHVDIIPPGSYLPIESRSTQ